MEPEIGTTKDRPRLQQTYEAIGASIVALDVREQCEKSVAKLRDLLRSLYGRAPPPPHIAD